MESVELLNRDREVLIDILTSELPVLRARLGISQEDISKCVGISRQTYSLVEGKKQKMTWVTFMALLSFFEYNPPAKDLLEKIGEEITVGTALTATGALSTYENEASEYNGCAELVLTDKVNLEIR